MCTVFDKYVMSVVAVVAFSTTALAGPGVTPWPTSNILRAVAEIQADLDQVSENIGTVRRVLSREEANVQSLYEAFRKFKDPAQVVGPLADSEQTVSSLKAIIEAGNQTVEEARVALKRLSQAAGTSIPAEVRLAIRMALDTAQSDNSKLSSTEANRLRQLVFIKRFWAEIDAL